MKTPSISAALTEELTESPLDVQGRLPDWLAGTLIRNGPVNVSVDGKTNSHWFDGLAMLHAFRFQRGQVHYTNRFLRTAAYSQVFKHGSLDYDGFAVDPCRSLFKRLLTWFIPQSTTYLHNANINVAKIANHMVALTETPLPVEFDSHTLDTLGVLNYQDQLPKKGSWESAHPHYEGETVLNYCIEYGHQSYYTLYYVGRDRLTRQVIAKIPVEHPAYMHSFAVTEQFIVLAEYPFTVKPFEFLINMNVRGKPFISNFSWHPEKGTLFKVIQRKTGQLIGSYRTEAFFAFHQVNAYEREGGIVLDLVCYDSPAIIDALATHFSALPPSVDENKYPTRLQRFHLFPKTGQVETEILSSLFVEFPRIHEQFDGKEYRYVYLIDPRQPASSQDVRPIYKIDVQTRKTQQWAEQGCYPGEPVFVANPEGRQEDEGLVLTVVFDQNHHRSFLLVLDAKTLQEVARTAVSHPIPPGLHGQYFPLTST